MTVHLVKLCVGAESVEDLERWVKKRVEANATAGYGRVHDHVTRMFPKRAQDLLDGGSIYWVIKGVVLVRQRIVGIESVAGADGVQRCALLMAPLLVAVEAQPRRAFQGWRYLEPKDAPADLTSGAAKASPRLRAELAELGLL